jgi:hypothetical protein
MLRFTIRLFNATYTSDQRICRMTESQIILYTTPDGDIKVDTVLQNETIWLTQSAMAELFGVQRPAITKHLQNIFDSTELDEQVVSSILEHTTAHGAISKLWKAESRIGCKKTSEHEQESPRRYGA